MGKHEALVKQEVEQPSVQQVEQPDHEEQLQPLYTPAEEKERVAALLQVLDSDDALPKPPKPEPEIKKGGFKIPYGSGHLQFSKSEIEFVIPEGDGTNTYRHTVDALAVVTLKSKDHYLVAFHCCELVAGAYLGHGMCGGATAMEVHDLITKCQAGKVDSAILDKVTVADINEAMAKHSKCERSAVGEYGLEMPWHCQLL